MFCNRTLVISWCFQWSSRVYEPSPLPVHVIFKNIQSLLRNVTVFALEILPSINKVSVTVSNTIWELIKYKTFGWNVLPKLLTRTFSNVYRSYENTYMVSFLHGVPYINHCSHAFSHLIHINDLMSFSLQNTFPLRSLFTLHMQLTGWVRLPCFTFIRYLTFNLYFYFLFFHCA